MRVLARVLVCAVVAGCGDGPSQPDPNTGRLRTFAQLVPGAYTVMAGPVSAGGSAYTPVPATQPLTVATDERDTATVAYAP